MYFSPGWDIILIRENDMKLILLTGFLGAGKTTLLQEMLSSWSREKLGVMINEFGEVNVDGQLLARNGIQMTELSNGSIFCACIKDKFVDGLIEMSWHDLDCVLIEATGLADPSSMVQILEGIRHKVRQPYDYRGSVCVVDGENFLDLYDLLPAIRSQLEYCSAVIVNKADRIDESQLEAVLAKLEEVNPAITPTVTSYCKVNLDDLLGHLDPASAKLHDPRESTNTIISRPATFMVKGREDVSPDGLSAFLREVAPASYRLKGFVNTADGPVEVSCVGDAVEVRPWDGPPEATALVVISAVGFKMMSLLIKAIDQHAKGQLWI
jgi:G3E family GTPase